MPRVRRALVASLALLLAAGSSAHAGAPRVGTLPKPAMAEHCRAFGGDAVRLADGIMVGRYEFAPHPAVTLTTNLTWRENPRDRNWQFAEHSLTWSTALLEAWAQTGRNEYRVRWVEIVKDWLLDNTTAVPPSEFSWGDHSTALRTMVLACAVPLFRIDGAWLVDAVRRHGERLADPGFYVAIGNHALDQSRGLLEAADVTGKPAWADLAISRIATLLPQSIDGQGVTNEGSIHYDWYNYSIYRQVEARMAALGHAVPASFSRIDLMPGFLAQATQPDGTYAPIGDTDWQAAVLIPGTVAEYAATRGASGPKPTTTVARYDAGYLFARTGWGESRRSTDETMLSLRSGPSPIIHGHADGGSLTLYGYGASLIVDPGKYTYDSGAWRSYFKGRTSHNIVTADGLTWTFSTATTLVGAATTTSMVDTRLRLKGYPNVTHDRRVTFSRKLGYVLVEDRLTATSKRTFRQLWHLPPDARPISTSTGVRTQRSRGNVLVRQLAGSPTIRFVTGQSSPIQGWVAPVHGTKQAAPVVEAVQSGTSVRYLTLLLTAPGTPSATVSNLSLTSGGYSVNVKVGSVTEKVSVNGGSASITTVGGATAAGTPAPSTDAPTRVAVPRQAPSPSASSPAPFPSDPSPSPTPGPADGQPTEPSPSPPPSPGQTPEPSATLAPTVTVGSPRSRPRRPAARARRLHFGP